METTTLVFNGHQYGQLTKVIPGLPVITGASIGTAEVLFTRRNDVFSTMAITVRSLDRVQRAQLIDPYGNMNALGAFLNVSTASPEMIGQLFGWYDPNAEANEAKAVEAEHRARRAADAAEAKQVTDNILAVIHPEAKRFGLQVFVRTIPVSYVWGERNPPVAHVDVRATFGGSLQFGSQYRNPPEVVAARIRAYCEQALPELRKFISPTGWLWSQCGYEREWKETVNRKVNDQIEAIQRALQ